MNLFMNLGPVCSDNSIIRSHFLNFERELKIGHYNIHSFSTSSSTFKLSEIRNIFEGNVLDIVGLSETWLKSKILSEVVSIPGYNICRSDRPDSIRAGGVALLISKGIKYNIVYRSENYGVSEAIFAEVHIQGRKLLIGVNYLPKGDLQAFEDSVGDILDRYRDICIMGDFNMDMFCYRKSNLVRQMCGRLDLVCHHNSAPTHYDVDKNSTSLIDYFFVSPSLVVRTSGQMQCPGISHHSLIYIALDIPNPASQSYFSYPNYSALNMEALEQTARSLDFSGMYTTSNVNIQLEIFMSAVRILHSLVPIVRRRAVDHCDGWFKSPEIVYHISLRDLTYKYYLQDRSPENWFIYCEHRNRAKAVIRAAKRRAHSDAFRNLEPGQMWSFLRGSGCLETDDRFTSADPDEANNYFVSCQTVNMSNNLDVLVGDIGNGFSFRCVDMSELYSAFGKIKSNAAGHDGLSLKFFKIIFPLMSSHILHLINTIILTSVFPDDWKKARVVPIKKDGLSDSLDNLRPISVIPIISKVFEHIVKDQMIVYLDANSLIHSSQSGFRRGYSTTALLLGLTDSIRKYLDSDKNVVLLSMDLSKAFDRVVHFRLVQKLLHQFEFSRQSCKLIGSYLKGRSQFVSIRGSCSLTLPITSGVPQGSVIGPLLFMMYMNDLLTIPNGLSCEPYVYADDVQFLCYADKQFLDVLEEGVNFINQEVLRWASVNGFSVNPRKTKVVGFGFETDDITVSLDGVRVEFVDKFKCLGVAIDNHLRFSSHIDTVSAKIRFLLRRLYSLDLYLPLSIRIHVARALLMPHILYCVEVFSGTTVGEFGRFSKILNRIVRFVYGVRLRQHITPYVIKFLGCTFKNYVGMRILIFFYKTMLNGYPEYLVKNYRFKRFIRNQQLIYPACHTTIYDDSFLRRMSRMWNDLPGHLRCFSFSPQVFKRMLGEYVTDHDLRFAA